MFSGCAKAGTANHDSCSSFMAACQLPTAAVSTLSAALAPCHQPRLLLWPGVGFRHTNTHLLLFTCSRRTRRFRIRSSCSSSPSAAAARRAWRWRRTRRDSSSSSAAARSTRASSQVRQRRPPINQFSITPSLLLKLLGWRVYEGRLVRLVLVVAANIIGSC